MWIYRGAGTSPSPSASGAATSEAQLDPQQSSSSTLQVEDSGGGSSNKKAEPVVTISANCSPQQQVCGTSTNASPATSAGKATTKFSELEIANRQQTPHHIVYKKVPFLENRS